MAKLTGCHQQPAFGITTRCCRMNPLRDCEGLLLIPRKGRGLPLFQQRDDELCPPNQELGLDVPARGASGAPPSRMTLSDIHALVKSMEACMVAQETKLQWQETKLKTQEEEILVLKRDNSELWQEIHRLKGPRFPFEIFSLIILSIGDKKALATFSLVSRGWMSVARGVLFKQISHFGMFWLAKIELMPILNNEHCTVFPYVQTIQIYGSMDDGDENSPMRQPDWMDDFLRLIPKFVALRSLELYCLDVWDFRGIQRSMPRSIKNNIKEVSIDRPQYHMSEFVAFVSTFTALETLSFGSGHPRSAGSESTQGLVSPPSSIRELLFGSSDHPTVLKWFIDLHSGIIDSIDPHDLPFENPVEFGRFLTRFGSTLSKIKFSISGDQGAVKFLHSGYCAAFPQLKSIQLDFWDQTFSYSYFDKSFLSTIEWLPKILALLPSSIEEIILSMDPNHVSPRESAASQHKLGTINWSRLDQSLTGSQYPSLRILKIRMCGYHTTEENQYMEEMWPKLLPICDLLVSPVKKKGLVLSGTEVHQGRAGWDGEACSQSA
ncbi:hypothetical protein DFH09DRAFT_1097744 [Mycena vulgaris]|nr:hypothetical protein DFH09DRAFT_1097744 [Mycena vulgaris]